MLTIETLPSFGWQRCCRIANDQIELIVSLDVGPRILRCGFLGGQNFFHVNPGLQGQTGGDAWQPYGGHRLWHAPEAAPRSYGPDNGPVSVEQADGRVRFTQPVEPAAGIQKEIEITLHPTAPSVAVRHRLHNRTLWPVELAPWALTVLAAGGTAILPLPPRAPHGPDRLLPTSQLTLWSYTDLGDPRWTLGTRYVLARQDPSRPAYQKIGLHVTDGWAGYARAGELFVKTFAAVDPAARYPDFNSTCEVFIDGELLELETLGPLAPLAPGGAAEHLETWHLWRDVPAPRSDADVAAHIAPRVAELNAG